MSDPVVVTVHIKMDMDSLAEAIARHLRVGVSAALSSDKTSPTPNLAPAPEGPEDDAQGPQKPVRKPSAASRTIDTIVVDIPRPKPSTTHKPSITVKMRDHGETRPASHLAPSQPPVTIGRQTRRMPTGYLSLQDFMIRAKDIAPRLTYHMVWARAKSGKIDAQDISSSGAKRALWAVAESELTNCASWCRPSGAELAVRGFRA